MIRKSIKSGDVRFIAVAVLILLFGVSSLGKTRTVETRIGTLEFELGVPNAV